MNVDGIRAVEGSCDGGMRFQRKTGDWWNVDRNGGRQVQMQAGRKKLGMQQNVFNLAIHQANKENSVFLSPLCSAEVTPQKSLTNYISSKNINDQSQPILKLQYSPDSIFSSLSNEIDLDQTDLLLDQNIVIDVKMTKSARMTTASRLSEMKEELQASEMLPCCTSFKVEEKRGLKVGLVSISRYVFRIDFQELGLESGRNCFRGDRLAFRIKKNMVKEPLNMFQFYGEVLCGYSSSGLRKFLIEKRIKFNTEEITEFQAKIQTSLEQMRPEELIEFIFITKKSEEFFMINIEELDHLQSIDLTTKCLWKSFIEFFKKNRYFSNKKIAQMEQFKNFLINLL